MSTDSPELLFSQAHTFTFRNDSPFPMNVCLYQTDPNLSGPSVRSLAWFVKRSDPGTSIDFRWTTDRCFVWARTGNLDPGVVFTPVQVCDADLSTFNDVTFTFDAGYQGGNFALVNQMAGPQPGNLYLRTTSTIPFRQAAVGVGMSGRGTLVQQASPNRQTTFTSPPRYWMAFGDFTEGAVLDVESIRNPWEIMRGVTSMTATLNADNGLRVGPTEDRGEEAEAVPEG
jgi:rhizosphere induced protein